MKLAYNAVFSEKCICFSQFAIRVKRLGCSPLVLVCEAIPRGQSGRQRSSIEPRFRVGRTRTRHCLAVEDPHHVPTAASIRAGIGLPTLVPYVQTLRTSAG